MKHQRILPSQRIEDAADVAKSPSWLIALPFFILGTAYSIWYLNAYHAGDSLFYTRFYDALYDMPTQHWADLQRRHLGSAEPLYRYIVGLGAFMGWDRILYLSAWNGVFVGAIGYLLVKYRCSPIFSILILSNFYLLVLLGPGERLKFAYLAFVLAFTVENRISKFALAASAPFLHTQAMVQFVSGFGYYLAANLRKFGKTPLKTLFLGVAVAIALTGVIYLFVGAVGQSIESKSTYYAEQSSGLIEAIQWVLILAGGLFVFKDKAAFFLAMLPMGFLTIVFGNRVNVATFALFVALAILQRKTDNPVVLAVMAYMSFKSIAFLSDVVQFGDGFWRE